MKYEFVSGDEKFVGGRTLKRIRALVAISAFGVTPGTLGGYVESEKNLNQEGNAWVYGDAQVYGNARVFGDAWVSGNARVYGNAWVSGDAQVYGNGLIFWASKVGTENGTLTVYNTKNNALEVTRGCFRGTVDEFLTASKAKHDDQTHLEYRLLIEVAYMRITRAREKLEAA